MSDSSTRWKNGRVKEAGAEFICADRLLVGAINARVFVVAVQEEFGGAEVICCAQVAVACAYAMTGSQLRISFSGNPLGCGIPLVIPAVVIAGCDAIKAGHDFAELAGAVAGGAEGTLGLEPVLYVVGKEGILLWRGSSFRGCAPRGRCGQCGCHWTVFLSLNCLK